MKNTVENLKGCFVKKSLKAKKIFEVMGYCRTAKAYELVNIDDFCDYIYVKKGTKLIEVEY